MGLEIETLGTELREDIVLGLIIIMVPSVANSRWNVQLTAIYSGVQGQTRG